MKKTNKIIQTKSDLRIERALAEIKDEELTWKNIKKLYHKKPLEWTGFIQEFIVFKYHYHEDPIRKGTPRGEKIGFFWVKQNACIALAVTNSKMKQIAEQLEISYGLLRKWKSEQDFQKEMSKHVWEFVMEILHRVDAEIEEGPKRFQDYIDGVNDDSNNLNTPFNPYSRVMVDAPQFSNGVMNLLTGFGDKFLKEATRKGSLEIEDEYFKYHLIFRIIMYGRHKIAAPLHPQLLESMAAEAKSIMQSKKTLSEKERRCVISRLDVVEKGLAGIHAETGLLLKEKNKVDKKRR